jgi:Mrp family chromosome partitioning ATPase
MLLDGVGDGLMSCHAHTSGSPADRQYQAEQKRETLQFNNPFGEVSKVIGVMSGKGGVGKSLVTAMLAIALRKAGRAVGVLDADITGPSIPRMLGIDGQAEQNELGLLPAVSIDGILVMSINLMLEHTDDPVIWRGPLLATTVRKFWENVVWGDLDVLLVDLPPGTSDVPLTVMQSLPLNGLLVVSSPQELSAMIVRKAIKMAALLNIPVLGLVENMTHLVCPHCGTPIYPFGSSTDTDAVRANGTPLLAHIPIDPEISALCDKGQLASYAGNPFERNEAVIGHLLR